MEKTKQKKISLETDFGSSGLLITGVACLLIIFFSIFMIYISSPPEKIYAAKVNGTPITLDEYNKTVSKTKEQYSQMLGSKIDMNSQQGRQIMESVERNTIESLVSRELLFQAATERNITADSSEIDSDIDSIKQKNFNGDEKLFHDTLRLNRTTLSQLKESLRKDKIVEKVRKVITDEKVKITDKEKQDYYAKNRAEFDIPASVNAAHILVKDEKLANDIYAQLQKGAKFEDLAKKYSTDPGSKEKGGDLGTFTRGKMVHEFEDAAFALKVGETSKPVKTNFGYHIIKKTGAIAGKDSTFAEVKAKITDKLKEQKSAEVVDKFVKEEKAKAKIEMYGVKPVVTFASPSANANATTTTKIVTPSAPVKIETKANAKTENKPSVAASATVKPAK